ncbi:MAG: DnaJ domain-containing protein [Paludibacteraceae bacterium]|nr:DnaJ domain-containing protein [Paludibacteraceae bacterium]
MDSEKIERLFESWRKKKMLTKSGALRVRSNLMYALGGLLLCPGFYFFFLQKLGGPLVAGVLAVLCYLVGMLLFPTHDFHKDRMELTYLWGLFRRKYYYTDIEGARHSSYYNQKSHAWVRAIYIRFSNHMYSVEEQPSSKSKFDALARLLSSGFKPLFVSELYYNKMVRLFANVIALKEDPQYQFVETQCALKYLSESKYHIYDYRDDLSEQIDQYNKYRRKNNLPAEMNYVNVCLSIMQDKSADYADRLELLTHLFECAYASDGSVDDEELDYLSRIAYYFCIKDWDLLSLKYQFEAVKQEQYAGQTESDAYAKQRERYRSVCTSRKREAFNLLGLKTDASLEEVKSAYRAQVKTCHPDTLPPTATEAEREEASQRFRTITEAYDFLCAELSAEPVSVAR